MLSFTIGPAEEGRKVGRYLEKLFPKAPRSFFYKALRQNKIKVNRKKPSDLNVSLLSGDIMDLYLSDEQILEFGYRAVNPLNDKRAEHTSRQYTGSSRIDISQIQPVYEDEHILIVVKPVGVLSQKSRPADISITEMAREYLIANGSSFDLSFTPSFVHRLDRNTGGLMIMAKDLPASQALSEMIRFHSLKKYYWALVQGDVNEWECPVRLKNSYRKDERQNKASILPFSEDLSEKGWQTCELEAVKKKSFKGYSLVEILLLTGKCHQIRAQLSFHGHPLVGDGKYNENESSFRQQLFAKAIEFHDCPPALAYMEGKRIEADTPSYMGKYL